MLLTNSITVFEALAVHVHKNVMQMFFNSQFGSYGIREWFKELYRLLHVEVLRCAIPKNECLFGKSCIPSFGTGSRLDLTIHNDVSIVDEFAGIPMLIVTPHVDNASSRHGANTVIL